MDRKKLFFVTASLILGLQVLLITNFLQAIPVPNLPSLQFDWPIPPEKITRISSTFGESRLDHFHSGVDIPGDGLPVFPMKEGRLIYKTMGKHKIGELPFGGGGTVILEHEQKWTGYMHLKKINLNLHAKQVTPQDQIGLTGNTGHSGGAHLHFFIFDTQENKMYNPLPFLPKQIVQDELPPKIETFLVQLPERVSQIDINKKFRMSQDFPILATITDQGQKQYDRWGVYFLKVYNQTKALPAKEIIFDYLILTKGQWLTSNYLPFDEVYFLNHYILGNQFRNSKTLTIETGGLSGPKAKRSYKLDIEP